MVRPSYKAENIVAIMAVKDMVNNFGNLEIPEETGVITQEDTKESYQVMCEGQLGCLPFKRLSI